MIHLLKKEYSKYIISIILGIGLGAIFRKSCKKDNCLVYQVPDLSKIHNKSFKYGKGCYKYELVPGKCNSTKKLIE
jgi:hypothetical protein